MEVTKILPAYPHSISAGRQQGTVPHAWDAPSKNYTSTVVATAIALVIFKGSGNKRFQTAGPPLPSVSS